MQKGKTRVTVVQEDADYGLWVWQCSNGRYFSDGNANFMNIKGSRFDLHAMAKLRDAAKAFGVDVGGKPVFLPRTRQVSDMEYSEQKDRMAQGYIPSETDIGAWVDAHKTAAVHGTDE